MNHLATIRVKSLRAHAASLILCGLMAGCATAPFVGAFNFKPVTPGLWRSGQPQTEADFMVLTNAGVHLIVKLNEERLDWERTLCAKYQIALVRLEIPLGEQLFGVPDWKLAAIADAVRADGTLVHCENGWDRTGLAVGMFRVGKQQWSVAAAKKEMLANGFHEGLAGLEAAWVKWNRDATNATNGTNVRPTAVVANQRSVVISWGAPLEDQVFYVYSTNALPMNLVPLAAQYPAGPLVAMVDLAKVTGVTNWPLVATVTGTNQCFFLMTNQQAFFAVRAKRNGMWSDFGTAVVSSQGVGK